MQRAFLAGDVLDRARYSSWVTRGLDYDLVRRALFSLEPETAHHLAIDSLRALGASPTLCDWLRAHATAPGSDSTDPPIDLSVRIAELLFPNPIGLAAGLDKDAVAVAGLFALGFGAVEVGTLTPREQPGNPAPRLFRIPERRALVNRMGFNNGGIARAAERLPRAPGFAGPVGVNVGRNKDTPNDRAVDDFVACIDALEARADYFVVNASSPNTPGLRALQAPEQLSSLLRAVRVRTPRPLFLKIAPDLDDAAIDAIVDVAIDARIEAIVATNTTLARPFVDDGEPYAHPYAMEAGGLSGAPLRARSTEVVRRVFARAQRRLAVVGVGGIFTAEDAYEKIRAGASFVQIYTGFVYGGPRIVSQLLRGLGGILHRDGFVRLSDAIGADVRGPLPSTN